jgi:L-gulonolactone oxidase
MPTNTESAMQTEQWISWNSNISHPYRRLGEIRQEEELTAFLGSSDSFRAFGTSQSSADICAGTEDLADMSSYARIVSIDRRRMQIRAQSGILLRDLILAGEKEGWSLPCLPDNDAITLGGAISTGTHGTTGGAHPLGEYMVSCSLADAEGNLREVGSDDPLMPALRCSLGLLGVLSEITMQFEPLRRLHISEEAVKDEVWMREWPGWLEENYFLRMLYIPHSGHAWVIRGNPVEDGAQPPQIDPPSFVRHRREWSRRLYGIGHPAATRMSNRILRRLFFSHRSSSTGSLYQATVTKKRSSTLELAEWTIGQDRFNEVFSRFAGDLKADRKAYAHIPMDIRFLKSDGSWLSNAYHRDIVTVGCVTRDPRRADEYRAFDIIERAFLSAGGRPHWAKRFAAGRDEISGLYEKFDDFIELRRKMDPRGKFLNAYLRELFA